MKGVLFLGLVGAAIYGAILLSYDALPRDPAEDAHAVRTLGNPGERQLRSWGTDLPALATSSSQEASLPLPAATTASSVISSTNSQYDGTAYQPVEWAKVAFAAKVHSDASVSSQHRASISPAPHYRSSADKTAGFKSPIPIRESAAGYSSNILCRPTVRLPRKPQ